MSTHYHIIVENDNFQSPIQHFTFPNLEQAKTVFDYQRCMLIEECNKTSMEYDILIDEDYKFELSDGEDYASVKLLRDM